jgi:hypothetical protein
MKIHQLSLFLENKPGNATEPCRLLGQAGIDIRTLMLADTQQFGILRLILSDWQSGKALLEQAGFVVNVTEVVAVEVPDRPGGLAHLLDTLGLGSINVEYMYAFTFGFEGRAVLIVRFDDPDAALAHLRASGINVLEDVQVYERIKA